MTSPFTLRWYYVSICWCFEIALLLLLSWFGTADALFMPVGRVRWLSILMIVTFRLTCNLTWINENRVSLLWSIECYLCINLECLLSLFKSSFLDSSWTTALCLDWQLPYMARKIENVSVWHTLLLAQRRNKPPCPSSRFERFSYTLDIQYKRLIWKRREETTRYLSRGKNSQ